MELFDSLYSLLQVALFFGISALICLYWLQNQLLYMPNCYFIKYLELLIIQ